jgi:hypothetical protein
MQEFFFFFFLSTMQQINLIEPYMTGVFSNKLSKISLSNWGMASKDSPKSAGTPPNTSFQLYSQ